MREKISKFISLNNFCFLFSLVVYILFTVYIISLRIPFFDEINAWNIAQNCSFTELLQVSRHEGHFLLWYLLIKPFAQNNIGFPVSMFVINWIFAFSAVLVLWLKAPFNPFIKSCITFSLPIQMFSMYARCYSIGMLILFILCSIYKKRFEHPLLYSFLIILLANTSVIGTLVAFVFGLIYFTEALVLKKMSEIKDKTVFHIFLIFLFGVVLVLSQLAFSVVPSYSGSALRLFRFKEFFFLYFDTFRDVALILMFTMTAFGFAFFKRNINSYLFLLFSNLLILFLGYRVFVLGPWHYMFLFINVIVAMWIYCSELEIKTLVQKIFYNLFILMCFSLVFYWPHNWYWNGFHVSTANYLKTNLKEYENSNIFLYPTDSSIVGIVPSMKDYKINFYDAKGYSYKSYLLYVHQWEVNKINFQEINNIIKKSKKNNYLFIQTVETFKQNKQEFLEYLSKYPTNLRFKEYKILPDAVIYKITKK